jgi:hypothetical protein
MDMDRDMDRDREMDRDMDRDKDRNHHCRWSDFVDRCWKNENDEAIICLQDRKLKQWSDIIASKCLILKR